MQPITADHPDAASADPVRDNLDRLRALFPEAFTEDGLDYGVLRQLLGEGTPDRPERYGLSWHGKAAARDLALTPSRGTLRPVKEDSVDWDTTQNLVIEGDNLEVLKLLRKSYAGRVKLIYIDPPYNTGKDFVYRDDYRDTIRGYKEVTGQTEGGAPLASNTEASGRFHTDWLNMMYPRLKAAHELLREDGFIFISVDDSEVAKLRSVMDEVFGDDNFVANVIWIKKYTRSNDARFFSDNHDHILVYSKEIDRAVLRLLPRSDSQKSAYSNPDKHRKGLWKSTPLHAKSGANTSSYTFENGVVWNPPPGTFRRFNDASMKALEEGDEIWFGTDGNATPSRKSFLSEVKDGVTPVTVWDYSEVGHNHEANSEVKQLVGGGVFSNPKPTRLLRRAILLATDTDAEDIVLDFFAGSGTTGHAVMAQNAADGGDRRYILVQLPEPLDPSDRNQKAAADFCADLGVPQNLAEVTKERLRRSAAKVAADHPEAASELDLGFRVYRLDTSNIRAWNPQPEDLHQQILDHAEHLLPGRTEADVLAEVLLKKGLDLSDPIETRQIAGCAVHAIGAGTLFVSLPERVAREDAEALALGIAAWRDALAPEGDTTAVFRDSAFDDVAKVNVTDLLRQRGFTTVESL